MEQIEYSVHLHTYVPTAMTYILLCTWNHTWITDRLNRAIVETVHNQMGPVDETDSLLFNSPSEVDSKYPCVFMQSVDVVEQAMCLYAASLPIYSNFCECYSTSTINKRKVCPIVSHEELTSGLPRIE